MTYPIQVNMQEANNGFVGLCEKVSTEREVVIIHRHSDQDVALIAADELSSLLETAHLLRSPKNADRLLSRVGCVSPRA